MKKLALVFALSAAAFADKTLVYEIPNMSCVSCYEVIVQTLGELKGVKNFEVNLEAKTAQIIAEDDLPQNAVVDALKKQGYQAVLKSEKQRPRGVNLALSTVFGFLAKAALELSKPAWRSFFNRRLNLGGVFCLNLRFKARLKNKAQSLRR